MKKALLWAISILLFSSSLSYASEARVDSMGGLTLVVTDESEDINPFILGNPAGLALIAPQTRFDVAGQWLKEYAPLSDQQFHIYGSTSELDNDDVKYHGLITFLNSNWAIQVDGDTLHNEGQDDTNNINTQDRFRGTFRTAYNFGVFTIGGQLQSTQTNIVFNPYSIGLSTQVTSGTGTVNSLAGVAGLLLNFLGSNDPKQTQLKIGGIISTQLTPTQEKDNLSALYSGTTSLTLNNTITDSNVLGWGPELYFQSPGFEASILGRFSDFDISYEQDSSNSGVFAGTPTFKIESGNVGVGIAVFKTTTPLTDSLNFKSGGLVSAEMTNSNNFTSSGNPNGSVSIAAWTAQAGIGFDQPQDYTVGVQVNFQQFTGNESDSGGVTSTNNFFDYKISVGGERWISKNWAFRLGVVYEDANNHGTAEQNELLFAVGPDEEIETTTIIAGIGYQDTALKLDFNLSQGQPSVINAPSIYANQYGAQLASSFNF